MTALGPGGEGVTTSLTEISSVAEVGREGPLLQADNHTICEPTI
jgi:hypothetical protein